MTPTPTPTQTPTQTQSPVKTSLNDLFLYCSEQPKTLDDSGTKPEKYRLSVESPLEILAEAMLESG